MRKNQTITHQINSAERKSVDISGFKFSNSGDGIGEGVFNKMFIVDDGADIVIELKQREKFLSRGFIADTHGMGNGPGSYTTATEVGIPKTLDVKNGDEIYGSFEFHSTDYAQDCRKVMTKRTANNLVAPFSIGYDLAAPPIFINSGNYETELKNYIPPQYLARCIEGAKQFRRIRLIKVILNEVSTVPIPMNTQSQATDVKTGTGGKKDAGDTWLNPNIIDWTTFDAIDSIFTSALWCCYGVRWDGDSEDAGADYAEIMQEAFDLIMKIIPAIMAVKDMTADEMKTRMMEVFGDPKVKEFSNNYLKDGIDRRFRSDLKDSIAILEWSIKRAERIAVKNAGQNASDPFNNPANKEEFKSMYSQLVGFEQKMTTILPELKAGATLSAASKKTVKDHCEEVIAKCDTLMKWADGSTDDEADKTTQAESEIKLQPEELQSLEKQLAETELSIYNRKHSR